MSIEWRYVFIYLFFGHWYLYTVRPNLKLSTSGHNSCISVDTCHVGLPHPPLKAELLAWLWVQQKQPHTSHKPCYHDTCRINYFCYRPAVDLHVNANPLGSMCQFTIITILDKNSGVEPRSPEPMGYRVDVFAFDF